MECRLLLSADPIVNQPLIDLGLVASETTANQVIFVDSAVDPGFEFENADLPGVAIVLLDTERDGIRQITDVLSGYSHLSAIHIVSHGAPGQATLGAATLSLSSLNGYADDLVAWGESLAEEGDILLYGCSVGMGHEGDALIQGLAGLTAADVAVSNDPTGPAELGGDCVLETTTGPIEAFWPSVGTLFVLDGLLTAGDLDTTFGTDGIVTTSLSMYDDYARAIAIQPNGKIVVAGYRGSVDLYDLAVARYNTDGSLDTSFSGDGWVTTDLGANLESARSVAIQSDGKIVVAGHSYLSGNYDLAVVRYNVDGSLDTSFDGDGKVITAITSGDDYGRSVAIQSDGKIVVAGRSASRFAVVRYNPDGSLDTSFDGDGIVTTAVGSSSEGYSVAILSDGKIVVAGASTANFALVRYNSDGSLDASFGAGGTVTTDLGSNDYGYSMAL